MVPNYMEYVNCDADLECYGELTDTEIVELIIEKSPPVEDVEIEDVDEENEATIPSNKEALHALNVLQKYCIYNNIYVLTDQIEDEILKLTMKSLKQKFFTEYFV